MRNVAPYMRIVESPDGTRKFRISRRHLESLIREAIEEAQAEDDEENGGKISVATGSPKSKDKKDPNSKAPKDDVPEVPATEDPADDEIEADAEEPDDEIASGDRPEGKLADELVGKTVQSVTMEPKSKILPGSTEIVLTFNEITDPLRILVSKTGQVKFFFRNSLHNLI